MRRGDVAAIADKAAGDYVGKPRPAVVVQSDRFSAMASVTVAPLTSVDADAPLLRLRIEPSATLPLLATSYVMVDKLTTVRRDRVGQVIGSLAWDELVRLDRSLVVFLGID